MPTVPSLNSSVSQSGINAPFANANAPIEAFGGGQTNPSSGFLKEAVSYADQEKKRFDQVNIQDYDTALSKVQTDLETQANQMRGKDAAGAQGVVDAGWKASLDSLDSMLSNSEQRAAAKALQNNRYESLYRSVSGHTAKELESYDVDSTNSSISNARDEAVKNYNDPEAIAQSIEKQHAALVLFSDHYGKGEEWLKQNLEANTSKTHNEVITRMLDNNQDLAAQAYFAKAKPELSGTDAADLEKKLRLGSLKGESQRQSDAILSQNTSYGEARDQAKAIKDPEVRDQTLKNIEAEFSAREKDQTYREQDVSQKLTKNLLETGGTADLPVSDLSALPVSKINAITDFKRSLLKGEDVPDNSPDYLNLSLMAHDPDKREEFANRDVPTETLGKVSVKQRAELIESWLKIREKDEVHTEFLNYQNANDNVIKQTLDSIGRSSWWSMGGLSDQDAVNFRVSVGQEMKQQEKALKRNLTIDETKKIVDHYATQVVVKSSMLGGYKKKELGAINPNDVDLSAIPADLQAQAKKSLRSRGMDPQFDEQNIKRLYVEALKSGRIAPSAE